MARIRHKSNYSFRNRLPEKINRHRRVYISSLRFLLVARTPTCLVVRDLHRLAELDDVRRVVGVHRRLRGGPSPHQLGQKTAERGSRAATYFHYGDSGLRQLHNIEIFQYLCSFMLVPFWKYNYIYRRYLYELNRRINNTPPCYSKLMCAFPKCAFVCFMCCRR